MKKVIFLSVIIALLSVPGFAQDRLYDDEFPIGDVSLLDGPLKRARDLNINTLLKYDCDRLLAPYRKEAGLEPKAPSYPNWDGLDGHVAGHYLSAMAMNAATGSKECESRMCYMVSELKACMEANDKNNPEWGKGYVGGVPKSANVWNRFRTGDFSAYFSTWAPFYNLHKMYAGLRDAWVYCGNEDAKILFLRFCDWAISITSGLTDKQMEQMLGNEHGGMDEVLADAFAITGEQKYLDCARRFAHKWLLRPMSQHEDMLDNKHANTQIPKVVGFERIAELTDDTDYSYASRFFWDVVTRERTIAIGGNSRREHFPSKGSSIDYVCDIDGPETCNTNNMLKLTEALHRNEPGNARYADFYELATFNHILSSQHPVHGGYVYFTPARPRHYRNYSAPNKAMWCCVGTGMENHSKYGQFIYTVSPDRTSQLYVNLFVASQLLWKERNLVLRQETDFPYGEVSKFRIVRGNGTFMLNLRYPGWVNQGELRIRVNGEDYKYKGKPGAYIGILRHWKKGDVIELEYPMHNVIEHLPNVPQYIAIKHGPIVLGMKTGTEDMRNLIADDSRFGQYAGGRKLPIDQAPYLVADNVESIADDLVPIDGKPLHFTLKTHMENKIEGELQPFFEIHDSRYMMYWLALSKDGYRKYVEDIAKAEKEREAIEARTTDKVQPGEQQPETDHKMETDKSNRGVKNDLPFRDARDGHYFSYLMQTNGETNLSLRLKFWGQDDWHTSEFDVFIDEQLAFSVNNTHKWRTSQWKTEEYLLPSALLDGKQQVRVKLVAKANKQIGEIYELRLVKAAK